MFVWPGGVWRRISRLLSSVVESKHVTVSKLSPFPWCAAYALHPFLPRDAMQSAVYAVARCLSVYLSATRRYSVETATPILKLFDSSHIILVFFKYQMAIF